MGIALCKRWETSDEPDLWVGLGLALLILDVCLPPFFGHVGTVACCGNGLGGFVASDFLDVILGPREKFKSVHLSMHRHEADVSVERMRQAEGRSWVAGS